MLRSRTPFVFALPLLLLAATVTSAAAASATAEYVGAWPFGPAAAMTFDASRDLAFVASGGAVLVVDVSDPSAPAPISDTIRTRGLVSGVALDGATNRLFVAADEGGLEIWDVADASAPQRLGTLGLTYFGVDIPAVDVAVWSHFAYVSGGFGYLHVVDVADPASPVDIGFNGVGGVTGSLHLAGTSLYVSGGQHFVRYALQPDGSLQLTGLNQYGTLYAPFESGRYVYGVRNGDFLIVDGASSTLPVVSFASLGNGGDVAVQGNIAYVTDGGAGIRTFNVANPAAPALIGGDPSVGASRVELHDGHLFSTGSSLFRALDVSSPSAPAEIGSLPSASSAYDVAVDGSFAYVADASRGLYVLDVADPSAPVEVGQAEGKGTALDVVVRNGHAFVAAQFEGLSIYDVQDPSAPLEVANQATPYYARGLDVDGSTAYVADLTGGLRVIDVADPSAPSEIGSAALAGANHVAVRNGVAYVAAGGAGVGVVDVSVPSAPVLVTTVPTADLASDIAVEGNRAFVADFDGGLRILDLSSPLDPVEVGSWHMTGVLAGGVAVAGDVAYVADAGEEVWILDVSNPSLPTAIDVFDAPGNVFKIALSGNDVFVADGVSGVQIARFGTPTAAPAVASAPHDTRVAAQGGIARFALPDRAFTLHVYDVRGRQVFSSRDRREVTFAPAASGAYFWRAEGGGTRETGKVVLVR